MNPPVAFVADGVVLASFDRAVPFVGPGGVQHPAEAWTLWTREDWAALCPGWTVLPLIDSPPTVPGKRAVPRPMTAWTVGADAVAVGYELVDLTADEIAAAGALLQQQVSDAVQRHLDATVQARNYDSMATCVTYAGEASVPRFQAEGRAARAWRSAVWDRCYAVLAEVLAGERAALTPAEMIAELPPLIWPD